MGKASREKGKAGEREAAELLREFGFEARRGQQFAGGRDSPDIIHDVPGVHFEIKRCERLSIGPALDQATHDAPPGDVPVVMHRQNRRDWIVVLSARSFLTMLKAGLAEVD